MSECRWCDQTNVTYTDPNAYIFPREIKKIGGDDCWVHRVQLWGIGSEVLKNCELPRNSKIDQS